MLSIGKKKYRNIQEQVGYNTECIEKLADAIDGITIEDKLVVIETDSGTFTPEELVILSGPLAFISNGSRVWMKDSESLTEFVFKAIDIKATEVGGTYFNIGGSKIVVTRATGVYNTSDDNIITTYSKSQIDGIVSNVIALMGAYAKLSGATFTGGVQALTLKQENPNANSDITRWSAVEAGLTATAIYTKMFVEAGLDLHVVVCLKLTNNSGASITTSGRIAYTQINYVNGSELATKGYASKIFDLKGVPLSTALPASQGNAVRLGRAICSKNISDNRPTTFETTISFRHYSTSAGENGFGFDIYECPSFTLDDGEVLYINAEMNLTL